LSSPDFAIVPSNYTPINAFLSGQHALSGFPFRLHIMHVSRNRKHIMNRNNGFRILVVILLSFSFNQAHGQSFEPEMVKVENFLISKYEITQGQWKAIMDDNPSGFNKGDNYPVGTVSWVDV